MRDKRGGEDQVHLWGFQTDRGAQRGTMDPWHGSRQHRFQRRIKLEHQPLLAWTDQPIVVFFFWQHCEHFPSCIHHSNPLVLTLASPKLRSNSTTVWEVIVMFVNAVILVGIAIEPVQGIWNC